ncbi:HigA family addiction module antitoxin [Undibacterium sp. Dicai25W]|uniref:HigA family addiction module antitoxin n=1 Tax=Undibacterium sp. Dicai25W TaxID=3413034 RepID=UPI003BF09F72
MKNKPIERDPNRMPTHPGEILKENVLPELRISRAALAKKLNVSRYTISKILQAKASLSAEISIALEAHVGSTAEQWMRMQIAHDLWVARRSATLY